MVPSFLTIATPTNGNLVIIFVVSKFVEFYRCYDVRLRNQTLNIYFFEFFSFDMKMKILFFCLLFDYFCFCVLSFFLIYFWYLLTGNEQVKL